MGKALAAYAGLNGASAASYEEVKQWDHQISILTVQNKLLEVTPLEQSSQVWKRLMFGLPAGQLSSLARASIITCLPTPTSLARLNMKVSPSCPLCQQATCTTKHILSCCKTALNQGRYTWRHDRALQIIAEFIKHHRADASVYCDLSQKPLTTRPAPSFQKSYLPLLGSTLSLSQLAASPWLNYLFPGTVRTTCQCQAVQVHQGQLPVSPIRLGQPKHQS